MRTIPGNGSEPFHYRDRAGEAEFPAEYSRLIENEPAVNSWQTVFRDVALFLILIAVTWLLEYLKGKR